MERTIGIHADRRKLAAVREAPERTKGETVPPVAVLELIARIGVTAAHHLLGVSTTTLHKARMPKATVSKVIELAAQAALREMDATGQAPAPTNGQAPTPAPTNGQAPTNGRVALPVPRDPHTGAAKTLVIMKVPADKVDDLEQIARAWGAEFTRT